VAPPMAMAATPAYPAFGDGDRLPTPEEEFRWRAPSVESFRKRLGPYLFVNGVIVLFAIFTGVDLLPVTVIWSMLVAYWYAKLWSDGYNWRDVFKQPQEKELIDVAEEFTDHVKALFDRNKRMEMRASARARAVARRSSGSAVIIEPRGGGRPSHGSSPMAPMVPMAPMAPSPAVYEAAGTHADRVRQAAGDRDEVVRLVNSLPDRERERVADVVRSANLLHERVQSLAVALADLERVAVAGGEGELEAEISRLEAQANPLEAGSEDRVRRLAFLKRQRRSVKDVQERRNAVASKLETCSIALRNMKLDVLRLRAGSQTHQHVTSLALEAVSLAESVDSALYVADELSRATDRPRGGGQRSARSG